MPAGLNHLRVWVAVLFVVAAFPALSSTNPQWFTRVWQIDDGLLDNDINGITQGPDDYLWLVTPVGLMQFDGVSFSSFPVEEYYGRPSLHIRIALCSRTGVVWLAFDGGTIMGLKPDSSIVSLEHDQLPTRSPYALASDLDGALWMAYADAVYRRAPDGLITKFTAKSGVPDGNFHALNCDGVGNIWLAKGNQICCFQKGQFHQIAFFEGVQCLAASHTNAVWLVANAHLFSCDTDGKIQDAGPVPILSRVRAAALMEDYNGSVWIGTAGEGLFRYDQPGLERVDTSHSSILSLIQDREGNVWVGTGGGGLDRITPCGIRVEALKNNQIESQIQSICQDTHGILWAATQNGALVFQKAGNWTAATNASFAGTVTCVAADRDSVWIGTRDGTLLRNLDNHYTIVATNIAPAMVRGLLPTSRGDLWIVGNDALQRLHNGKIQNIPLPRPVNRVSAIAEDAAENIWVGANGLLLRFNGSGLVNETARVPLSNRPICCLYGTDDGSLWIGSRGGRLIRLKDGNGEQIGLKQGLVDNYISQIVADGRGWLWFASSHGIFKLRERELEEAMQDHSTLLRPIIYGKNEGLISQEAIFSLASPFILPHAILGGDGRVWMLTHTGVVVANPNVLSDDTNPPPVLLTQIAMDGQIIASHEGFVSTETGTVAKTLNSRLKIPPSHRHLEFDFTAFHYRAPENLQFRYQLVGYDNAWIPAGAERNASYSRLTAGPYQFRVEASIGDGPWSGPATLDYEVIPFFWQTWWFRAGAVLLFTLSLIAIVRYVSYRRLRLKLRAMEQQAAVERERGRIARDIHDDLGNRLTEIQLLTGLAQRNGEVPRKAMTHIDEISSAARQATDALDEIVWAINPRNDTLPHLINYLGQFATDFMRTAGIQCRVDLPENPPAKSVSAEVRHNVFLAMKESLSNIARHSDATEVSMLILATDNSLSIMIKDNGRGFSPDAKTNGANGLENMRLRIAEIGGQFQLKSGPGAGTSISFSGLWLEK